MCWLGAAALLLSAGLGLAQDYPFQDPSLPWEQRLDDLMGRLTLGELVLQMARGGAQHNGPAPPIERLGIKPYNWNTECLRGDAEAPGWATAFPQALGLAASFSPELIYHVANATATEVRAKHNYFVSTGNYGDHTGLSCFSPVLNIMRHPLWGRNQETYGEDPFLSAELAVAFVQGLQGDHPRYVKASAGCKHFSVHGGPENVPVSRFTFDAKDFSLQLTTGVRSLFGAYVRQRDSAPGKEPWLIRPSFLDSQPVCSWSVSANLIYPVSVFCYSSTRLTIADVRFLLSHSALTKTFVCSIWGNQHFVAYCCLIYLLP